MYYIFKGLFPKQLPHNHVCTAWLANIKKKSDTHLKMVTKKEIRVAWVIVIQIFLLFMQLNTSSNFSLGLAEGSKKWGYPLLYTSTFVYKSLQQFVYIFSGQITGEICIQKGQGIVAICLQRSNQSSYLYTLCIQLYTFFLGSRWSFVYNRKYFG